MLPLVPRVGEGGEVLSVHVVGVLSGVVFSRRDPVIEVSGEQQTANAHWHDQERLLGDVRRSSWPIRRRVITTLS